MLQRRKQRPLSVADLVEHDERVPVVGALLALEHSLCDRGIARAVTRGSSPGWERAGERVNRRPRARKAGEVGSDARALAYLTRSETRSERWKKHARDQPRLCRVLPASKHTNLKKAERNMPQAREPSSHRKTVWFTWIIHHAFLYFCGALKSSSGPRCRRITLELHC
jgi:hypothetical protein